MLRPALIVTRLPNVRRLNFTGAGQLKIPRQTGGISGAYIGEGTSIIVQRLNFDQLALTPSKLACIVGVTNELLRRSDPSIEMLIRDDLVEGTARTVDAAFMKTAAAPPAPPGLLTKSAELVAGEIPAAATFTQVRDAVRAMITAIRLANVQMLAPAWIMNPRTVEYLRMLIVSGTVDAFAFKMEIDQGTFFGFPIIASTNVPISGVDQSAPYALVDCSQILFADDLPPVIDASEEATIQSDSAPATPPATPYTSAWQQDLVLFRIRMSHSWDIRHVEAVVWSKSFV
jgi:HK97 family phage major capsid protein